MKKFNLHSENLKMSLMNRWHGNGSYAESNKTVSEKSTSIPDCFLTDIHCHTLFGVDDGAADEAVMQKMIDIAYNDGIRCICLTPHFAVANKRINVEQFDESLKKLLVYIEKYPDLCIKTGNEILWHVECTENLANNVCRTIAGTNIALIEFDYGESYKTIRSAVALLANSGYRVIIAHIERYVCLREKKGALDELMLSGAMLQANAEAIIGGDGLRTKFFLKRLLKNGFIFVVASDAHDDKKRIPVLSKAYNYVSKLCGKEYADEIFILNPNEILNQNKR